MLGKCHNDPVSELRDGAKANFRSNACAPSCKARLSVRKPLEYAPSMRTLLRTLSESGLSDTGLTETTNPALSAYQLYRYPS
jgi:hypothetical protein